MLILPFIVQNFNLCGGSISNIVDRFRVVDISAVIRGTAWVLWKITLEVCNIIGNITCHVGRTLDEINQSYMECAVLSAQVNL